MELHLLAVRHGILSDYLLMLQQWLQNSTKGEGAAEAFKEWVSVFPSGRVLILMQHKMFEV